MALPLSLVARAADDDGAMTPAAAGEATTMVVAPLSTVTLSLSRDGRISQLPIFVGSVVRKGQLVIEMDSTEQSLNLAKAQHERRSAELASKNLGKARSIEAQIEAKKHRFELLTAIAVAAETKQISPSTPQERYEIEKEIERLQGDLMDEQSQLLQAALDAQAKQAAEHLAEWEVQRSKVFAPFDGVIRVLQRNEGDVVKQGDAIAELSRLDRLQINILYFTADVTPGEVIGRVLPIRAIQTADGRTWTGEATITRVVPGVSQSQTFRAYAEFDNEPFVNSAGILQWRIWPGMEMELIK